MRRLDSVLNLLGGSVSGVASPAADNGGGGHAEQDGPTSKLPDGKIFSLPFLGLRQGAGCWGTIQGKEGIKFCSVA